VLFALATSERFERAARAVAEERAWRSARRYVAGRDAEDALRVARALLAAGLTPSVDLFGERVTDGGEVERVTQAYVALAARLPPGTWVSLDLSHVAFAQAAVARIAAALPDGAVLQVGAEEAAYTDCVLVVVEGAHRAGQPVMATLQANLRRSAEDADRLAAAGVPVRLVKGAYLEPPAAAFPYGPQVDAAYARLARRLAADVPVSLATHDRALRESLLPDLPGAACELLLGIHEADALALAARGREVRVYVPYGDVWFRYFMRRRAEAQGAGSRRRPLLASSR
jgi:proline dehydrogenase